MGGITHAIHGEAVHVFVDVERRLLMLLSPGQHTRMLSWGCFSTLVMLIVGVSTDWMVTASVKCFAFASPLFQHVLCYELEFIHLTYLPLLLAGACLYSH
jgi:hypothetical protein